MKSFEPQPDNEAYEKKYGEVKYYLQVLFNDKDDKMIDELYAEVRAFAGIVKIDPEPLIEEIKKGLLSDNADEFVSSAFEILKPLVDKSIEQPEAFEKQRRERVFEQGDNIRLSELLYYNFDLETGTAYVHSGYKAGLEKEGVITAFRKGLKELGKQVKAEERIKEIRATSWIVAAKPGLLKKMGFTVEGPISEELRAKHFSKESRPISSAHISREKFLEEYYTYEGGHWELTTDLAKVEKATGKLKKRMNTAGWDADSIFKMGLAFDEALTNAMKHGNKLDTAKKVLVDSVITEEKIKISVHDEGEGFDPGKVPDPTVEERKLVPTGRGVFLMRQIFDKVEFSDNGRQVTLIKHR